MVFEVFCQNWFPNDIVYIIINYSDQSGGASPWVFENTPISDLFLEIAQCHTAGTNISTWCWHWFDKPAGYRQKSFDTIQSALLWLHDLQQIGNNTKTHNQFKLDNMNTNQNNHRTHASRRFWFMCTPMHHGMKLAASWSMCQMVQCTDKVGDRWCARW